MEDQRRLLFICTINRSRSKTAEDIFSQDKRFKVKSAGTAPPCQSRVHVSLHRLNWADDIFVMESVHAKYLMNTFPQLFPDKSKYQEGLPKFPGYLELINKKRLYILDIADVFAPNESELEDILKQKVSLALGL